MLKWQENFLAGESVKNPEKIKKKTEQRKNRFWAFISLLWQRIL